MSRRTKLTPSLQERIAAGVADGLGLVLAAKSTGVSEPTFFRWLGSNREFRESIVNAQTQAEKQRIAAASTTATQRQAGARAKFAQLKGSRDCWVKRMTTAETEARLEISHATEWRLRSVLGLVEDKNAPRSRRAMEESADAVLKSALSLISVYGDGYRLAAGDPRFALAVVLGLETGRRWEATGKRTGRRDSKRALLEVRP